MKGTLVASLAAAGLIGGGCASMTDVQALNVRVETLGKQVAGLEQKMGASEKVASEMKDAVTALKKTTEELKEAVDNQARINVRLESMLAQARSRENATQPAAGGNVAAGSQPGSRAQDWRQRQIDQAAETLKLNDEQKQAVQTALTKAEETMHKAMAEMRESGQPIDRDKMRASMQKSKAEIDEAMKKALSAEQFAEYQKLMEQMQHRGFDRGGNRPGGISRQGGGRPAGDKGQGGDNQQGGKIE